MNRILITGATGFLGSEIAAGIGKDNELIALKRRNSDLSRWTDAGLQPTCIDLEGDWKSEAINWKPDIIVHSAWIGVEATERDDWGTQIKNIQFLSDILDVAAKSNVKKLISMGSQAEYGYIDTVVKENAPLEPNTAYGAIKVAASQIVKTFCIQHNIDWYWLRLFSFFGEGESENWLIPSVIKKMLNEEEVNMTEGKQQYAYLYVKDLSVAVQQIIKTTGNSGIYNISSGAAITLKALVENIRELLGVKSRLNFGAIPYRQGQSMLIQGDATKFNELIGTFEKTTFDTALMDTVNYYQTKFKSSKK